MLNLLRLLAIALVLAHGAGCVSIGASAAIDDADRSLAAATAAGAEVRAPYPWWSARAYLDYARSLAGRADYQAAVRYAQRAARFADDAKTESGRAAAAKVPTP